MENMDIVNEFHEVLALSLSNLLAAEDPHQHLMVSYQECWQRTAAPEYLCPTDTTWDSTTYNCDPLCKYQWMLWNQAFQYKWVQALGLFYVWSSLLNIWGGILGFLWFKEASKMLNINATTDMIRASQMEWERDESEDVTADTS